MKLLVATAVAAVLTLPAIAAPHEGKMQHRVPGQTMMMGGGMGKGGERLCHIVGSGHHNDGTFAFLKVELKITPAQQAAWDAFATAYRGGDHAEHEDDDDDAAAGHGRGNGMHDMQPLPERMATHEKMMEERLAEMKRMHAAVGTLYSSLVGEQKHLADELIPAFMMCRMHM